MASRARQFLFFVSFACGWSLLLSLAIDRINVAAVFAVWLVGIIWGCGYIAAGKREADLMLRRWLQMMVGIAIIGIAGALIVS